jgi:hypothetical protein
LIIINEIMIVHETVNVTQIRNKSKGIYIGNETNKCSAGQNLGKISKVDHPLGKYSPFLQKGL